MFKNIFLLIFLPFFMVACDAQATKNEQFSIVVAETGATAVPTEPSPPTEQPAKDGFAGAVTFNLQKTAVLSHTRITDWKAKLLGPGPVLFHDNQFHLFFNGSDGWPSQIAVGYATSPDGHHWTLASTKPIFSADGISYTDFTLSAASVLVQADGTWVMYFNSVNARGSNQPNVIGRAIAPAPTGPWTADPNPVLTPDPGGWDAFAIADPSVVYDGDQYIMYYSGQDQRQSPQLAIGRATSSDGITWIKTNDPSTTSDLFYQSDPVFTLNPEREFAGTMIWDANVQITPKGYIMSHLGLDNGEGRWFIGYAMSTDGVAWTAVADNTNLSTTRDNWQIIYNNSLLYANNTTYLFFNPRIGFESQSDIYLATLAGDWRLEIGD
jgi:hypothetical protein